MLAKTSAMPYALQPYAVALPVTTYETSATTSTAWKDIPLTKELVKCLNTGGLILKTLGLYDVAYQVVKYENKILSKQGHTFIEIVECKSLLLGLILKLKSSNRKRCKKLGNEIAELCFKRLSKYPILELVELKIVISALKVVLRTLFECGYLDEAEELGKSSFQLVVLVKDQKELSRVLNLLAHIYFYRKNFDKCFEMISQLGDAFHQCEDPIADVIFFTTLALVLRDGNWKSILQDKVNICNEYASRCPGMPNHPKYKDRVFCLCSFMTVW
ncbi:uncharacterized protein NPIL_424591 [Nephila pilipes]|uniref:Uncharacterized protein n=1 Tax=Nephila pilipes TaxID=299642 RepID=A0A8X6TMC3_NEPPI|nr:uncharacterized protein NPIL_424591 [Nephila pilipes]